MILLIKKYRLEKKMTLRYLATKAECSNCYLNQLENNKKKNPRIKLIEKIGHALQICPIKLLGGCLNHLCTPNCYYFKDKYKERYSRLPPPGKKRLETIIRLTEELEKDFKEYLN